MRFILALIMLCSLCNSLFAQPGPSVQDKISAAMASEIRTAQDRERDIYRKPAQVLEFFGLQDDMRDIEILPFGGWYSKILGPVLRENGHFYTTQPDLGSYSEPLDLTLTLPGMDKVTKLDYNPRRKQSERDIFIGTGGDWDVEPVDMVLTFQNYHNLNYKDRLALNVTVFNALKPGGVYGIVDHTRRHNEADTRTNGRRVDPLLVVKEVQESGFILEDYSDLLFMPDDELVLEVGQPQVSGKSDRFILLFRKPD